MSTRIPVTSPEHDRPDSLYRIHWRALGGATGHSTRQLTQAEAERMAAELNRTATDLVTMWAEPVTGQDAGDA